MRHDDFDRMLSGEEDIVPSSGFVTSVMDAVRREAATPPPIPFPWKWALPGLAAWTLVLVSFLIAVFVQFDRGSVGPSVPVASPAMVIILEGAKNIGVGWIALALLTAWASVTLSMRIVGART
jgi:hypothetical protein